MPRKHSIRSYRLGTTEITAAHQRMAQYVRRGARADVELARLALELGLGPAPVRPMHEEPTVGGLARTPHPVNARLRPLVPRWVFGEYQAGNPLMERLAVATAEPFIFREGQRSRDDVRVRLGEALLHPGRWDAEHREKALNLLLHAAADLKLAAEHPGVVHGVAPDRSPFSQYDESGKRCIRLLRSCALALARAGCWGEARDTAFTIAHFGIRLDTLDRMAEARPTQALWDSHRILDHVLSAAQRAQGSWLAAGFVARFAASLFSAGPDGECAARTMMERARQEADRMHLLDPSMTGAETWRVLAVAYARQGDMSACISAIDRIGDWWQKGLAVSDVLAHLAAQKRHDLLQATATIFGRSVPTAAGDTGQRAKARAFLDRIAGEMAKHRRQRDDATPTANVFGRRGCPWGKMVGGFDHAGDFLAGLVDGSRSGRACLAEFLDRLVLSRADWRMILAPVRARLLAQKDLATYRRTFLSCPRDPWLAVDAVTGLAYAYASRGDEAAVTEILDLLVLYGIAAPSATTPPGAVRGPNPLASTPSSGRGPHEHDTAREALSTSTLQMP